MECYESSRNEVNKLRMKHPEGLVVSDIIWPKKLFYRPAAPGKVQDTVDALKASLVGKKGAAAKNAPRFVMSTDGEEILAFDTKTGEAPDFDRLAELPVNYDYLQPMFGVERYKPAPETAADVRAARHMAKFHDAIRDANPTWKEDHIHDLNLFMTRLLFCMFAEDTGIFPQHLFVETIRREAALIDGSDTHRVIEDIFLALDINGAEQRQVQGVRSRRIAADFPYVNGGLFRDRTPVPKFNRKARRLLLEAADLHWDQIHADIFGSMIQAIVQTDMRADFGMHYTSVPNIMKVLEPLFLGSLREQLTAAGDNIKALEKLLDRISRIRVFDPACGSGNFLIIAYRELRLIETEAFKRLRDVKRKGQFAFAEFSTGIKISNFYGIDPVDFACETAKLSLWISQYQMNKKLAEICSNPAPALPLTDAGSIIVGNALRQNWDLICPATVNDEVYIVGNPPYLGSTFQTDEQKDDIRSVFQKFTKSFKKLDYVSCWYLKAAIYNSSHVSEAAFVSTNSIFQGEQVSLLWPIVSDHNQEISFAYTSFKWKNNAAHNAGVTCVIVGIRNTNENRNKFMFKDSSKIDVKHINHYLIPMEDVFVLRESFPLSYLPLMEQGVKPSDGGNLFLTPAEKIELLSEFPDAKKFIRSVLGSSELLNGKERYCLLISDEMAEYANSIPFIQNRLQKVREFRLKSTKLSTVDLADFPHRFDENRHRDVPSLIVPVLSSERRRNVIAAFIPAGTVTTNLAFTCFDAPTWLFSILSSKLMFAWMDTVGSKFKVDPRFSNTLVYNTFPLPVLSSSQLCVLEDRALDVIRAREPYIAEGKTLAWLYDPNTMPEVLKKVHDQLDIYIESIFIGRPFRDDIERLEHLFKLYSRLTKATAKTA